MSIPTEPIGSIPRPQALLDGLADRSAGKSGADELEALFDGDRDSTHSLDIDYAELLPSLFSLHAGAFYLQLASESEPDRLLAAIAEYTHPEQRIFVGVIDPIDPRVETPEQVCERVLRAAEHISPERLGTCDDCGFSPFGDDTSTSRETAWAKIRARVEGTALAADRLGV